MQNAWDPLFKRHVELDESTTPLTPAETAELADVNDQLDTLEVDMEDDDNAITSNNSHIKF